jgi:DHA1 family inner membrane transport protein
LRGHDHAGEALPVALLALAIGAFGIGSTEFLMMGLLPAISAAFHVSVPTAGNLISGYALGMVVGAPLLTAAAAAHVSRKTVLLGLMAVFTAGNLLAALAPSYGMLLAARMLTGLPHGAFLGVGSVVAAGLVPAANLRAFAFRARPAARAQGGTPRSAMPEYLVSRFDYLGTVR